jgi:CheY-like chemotaxis protein
MFLDANTDEAFYSQFVIDEANLSEINILIVDNNKVSRAILKEQLSSNNANVIEAESAREALDKLNECLKNNTPIDIAIIDLHMPGMNGEELAVAIKTNDSLKYIILILTTSSPAKGDGKKFSEAGFSGYITKPIHPSEATKIIETIWSAKLKKINIPLVTRHTIKEVGAAKDHHAYFKNVQILLAEDNAINQAVATEMLTNLGCIVTPAGNGKEAVDLAIQRPFDIIFMDCQMPELDGFEASEDIRCYEKKHKMPPTPIIAFTANAMQGDMEKCLAAGMDDYVTKPATPSALEHILTKWIPERISSLGNEIDSAVIKNTTSIEEENLILDRESLETLYRLMKGNTKKTLKSYIKTSKEYIKQIASAINNNDLSIIHIIGHTIKSSSEQVGAMTVSKIATKIEALPQDKLDIKMVKPLYKKLAREFERAEKAINTYIADELDE